MTKSPDNADQTEVSKPASAADEEAMTLLETTQSVLWAMLGVQKEKNARRDFRKGKASHFILIGIAFGIVFILVLASIVNLVLGTLT